MKNLFVGLSIGLLFVPFATYAASSNTALEKRVTALEARIQVLEDRAAGKPIPSPSLSAKDRDALSKERERLLKQMVGLPTYSKSASFIRQVNGMASRVNEINQKLGYPAYDCGYLEDGHFACP